MKNYRTSDLKQGQNRDLFPATTVLEPSLTPCPVLVDLHAPHAESWQALGAIGDDRGKERLRALESLDTVASVNPHLFRNMGLDPMTDLLPVANLGTFQLVLLVHRVENY